MANEELVMTNEELGRKAAEWIRSQGWSEESLPNDEYCQMYDAFLAGAKIMQKENEQLQKNNKHIRDLIEAERQRQEKCNDVHLREIATLEKENERLVKRICELQSDLSREKSLNEKMKRCSNCIHRFVRHFSQEGTCQRPNCKNYSEWCFDGKRP